MKKLNTLPEWEVWRPCFSTVFVGCGPLVKQWSSSISVTYHYVSFSKLNLPKRKVRQRDPSISQSVIHPYLILISLCNFGLLDFFFFFSMISILYISDPKTPSLMHNSHDLLHCLGGIYFCGMLLKDAIDSQIKPQRDRGEERRGGDSERRWGREW